MTDEPGNAAARDFVHALLVWLLLTGVNLALSSSLEAGVLRDPLLPFPARLALFCTDAALQLVLVLVVGRAVIAFERVARPASRRGVGRAVASLAVFLPAWIASFLFVLSWAAFRSTGHFPGALGIHMWLLQFKLMIRHINHAQPVDLVAGIAAAAALAALALYGGRWASTALAEASLAGFRRLGLAAAVAAAVAAVGGGLAYGSSQRPVFDDQTGGEVALGEVYRFARDFAAGPSAHALLSLRRTHWSDEEPQPLRELPLEHRPLLSPGRWAEQAGAAGQRWNVVVLLIESLRPDQLTTLGGARVVMPNLDRLARRSVLFPRAYTQSSHSNYADPCPLSSQYPLRSKDVHYYPQTPAYPRVLIYDLLDSIGYETAIVSSQNEHWGNMLAYLDTGHLDHILHAENYRGDTYVPHDDTVFADWVAGTKRSGKIDDRFTINEAISWIEGTADDPFFAYINLQNSHVPYTTPADFGRRFGPKRVDFPIVFGYFPRHRVDTVLDVYADSLAYVDAQVGRLIDFLEESGRLERTIFVISGDTGQAFYEHDYASHGGPLYEEVMRVPLIVHIPGEAHRIDERLAQHIDIPPTILDALGLPAHPAFQGRSLLAPPDPDGAVFLLAQTPMTFQSAVVRGDWKLIWDEWRRHYLLYDLAEDPGETRDLSRSYSRDFSELQNLLHNWRKAQLDYYGDPARLATEYPPVLRD